jgi:hypothetical protein
MTTETNHSLDQARAQYATIVEMLDAYNTAVHDEDCYTTSHHSPLDAAEQAIIERPLSVEVRSGWLPISCDTDFKPDEYRILLCTGGPAVQITGDCDDFGGPLTARLQHQDWGTPWTDHREGVDEQVLIQFAGFFLGGF